MASSYTTNYGLCQWEPGDSFVRTEFNQDNARIDAAIKGVADTAAAETAALAERVTAADRGHTNLTYNVYDMAMKSYYENKVSGQRRAMFVEDFETEDYVAELGGELHVQVGALVLPWSAEPATMTTVPLPLAGVSWSKVFAWVKCLPGVTYTMAVSGIPMTHTGTSAAQSMAGTECQELAFEAAVPGSESVVLSLTLTARDQIPPRVYEYGVIFL